LPDSNNVNPSDVQPVSQPTVQEVSVPGPPEIAAPSTSIYIAEPLIKDVPAELPCVQEESVIPSARVSTDVVAQAVKFANILSEEEFIPDYDELPDDDDVPKQDIETQTDDDLVARITLLGDQLKKERTAQGGDEKIG
jgi:hypothetical protein